jgi:hypothetical protein
MNKTIRRLALLAASTAVAAAVVAPGADASYGCFEHPVSDPPPGLQSGFGVADGCFDQRVSADESETAFTQAAGHPYEITTRIDLNSGTKPMFGLPSPWPEGQPKDILVDAPPGFVGNLSVTPKCSVDLLATEGGEGGILCPAETQVGVLYIHTSLPEAVGVAVKPVYNLEPPPGLPALFGTNIAGVLVILEASLRTGSDYGVTIGSRNISEGIAVLGTDLELWGTPADSAHDPERYCAGSLDPGCPSTAEPVPFLTLPTDCPPAGQGLVSLVNVDSWLDPGTQTPAGRPNPSDPSWRSASVESHLPPGILAEEAPPFSTTPDLWGAPTGTTGCAQVPFEPTIAVKPTTDQADSPSGLEVDLSIPQDELNDSEAIAQSDLKGAKVTLPDGMTVNPSSADGLGGCTLAQIDLHGDNTEPACPDSSKIGTVEIKTPLLDEELEGAVYLAAQHDNPFGSLLALYIVAEARGQVIKLAGHVEPGPAGQLVTTFENQPKLPFENLHLVLKGGARAPLRTPSGCGTHTARATLTPWSGNAPVDLTSSFQISTGPAGAPCPTGQFDPKLSAGTTNPIGGAYSPFTLRLRREDGTRELTAISATLPEGLLGRLAGIPYCADSALASVSEAEGAAAAQITNPTCPAASLLGRVTVGAGSGPNPFYVDSGRAYLAGPYQGAPLSMAIVTPAKAGPFDLGSVLVRTALRVDPVTSRITAASDPLPRFLHGISLDLRDIRVDIDRPAFTFNPTSCDPLSIDATIGGADGASADRTERFQVVNCDRLPFKPRLSFRLEGSTKRASNPKLIANLTARPGEANIARAQVKLPPSAFLDNSHIKTVCTRVQFASGNGGGEGCPKGSIYGRASARTPLLDYPVKGTLYLRSSSHTLPDLVVSLRGPDRQPILVVLAGKTDSVKGALRNTFEAVPDAPVSKFHLELFGGRRGLVEMSDGFCAHPRATVELEGQNGKVAQTRPVVRSDCAKAGKRGRHAHGGNR